MHSDRGQPGRPVLLLHGGGLAGWMWRPVLDALDDRVRAIVPDLPGHGSSADRNYPGHAPVVAELAALLRSAAPDGAVVVGFSLGAQLAILLASEHPDLVSGTVIVSGEAIPAPLPRFTLQLLRWAAPLARQAWFARAQAKQLGIPEALLDDYVHESGSLRTSTLLGSVAENIRFTLPERWAAFSGQVAVLAGARERRLMRDSATLIHAQHGRGALTMVPGAHHDIPFSHPELLARTIAALAHERSR